MEKTFLFLSIYLVAICAFGQTNPTPCGAISNANFESGLSGWSPSGGATTTTTNVHSGSASALISGNGGIYNQTPILPNTTYRFSVWANTNGSLWWASANISILNSSYGTEQTFTPFNFNSTLSGWTYFEISFTTSANARFMGLWMGTGGPNGLLLDAVCLDQQAPYIPPSPSNVNVMNTGVYCAQSPLTLYPEATINNNLVVNPSFSSGNTGFTSGYTFNNTNGCGRYRIGTNATDYGWTSCPDHTTGTGNMMLVNPSATANATIWGQTVTVLPSSSYNFAVWIASPSSSHAQPATVQLRVNGVAITGSVVAPYQPCNWMLVEGNWHSGTSTSAALSIINVVGNCTGQDIMIDDIWFSRTGVPVTYNWAGPSGFTSNQQNPTIPSLSPAQTGTYTVTVTASGGATYTDTHVVSLASPCLDCEGPAQVQPTNPTSCNGRNGSLLFTSYNAPSKFEASIDGINYYPEETVFSGLGPGIYYVQIRRKANQQHCRTVRIVLTYTDPTLFSGTSVSATSNCTSSNGSITLNGLASGTEISWISRINETFVPQSSLVSGNRITGLGEGRYYVTVRRVESPFCVREAIIDLPSASGVCTDLPICSTVGPNLFTNGDFGSGSSLQGPPLNTQETEYGYVAMTCRAPDDGLYTIIRQTDCDLSDPGPNRVFDTWQILTEDHTPGDVNGYMMMVNASFAPDVVFERQITGLCPNTLYQFSLWVKNLLPVPGSINPNLTFLIDGVGKYSTGDITGSSWVNVGFSFYSTSSTATFSVRNNAPGGSGNDWLLDDIFVGLCVPTLVNFPTSILCPSAESQRFTTIVTDPIQQYSAYQWQTSNDGGATWTNVGSPQTGTFSGSSYSVSFTIPGPISTAQNGTQFRLAIATSPGNLGVPGCGYNSPSVAIQVANISASASAGGGTMCQGGTLPVSVSVTPTGTYNYQWQQSTSNTGPWTNISGATSSSYAFTTSTPGTYWFQNVYTDANNCQRTASPVSISVVNTPSISISPSVSDVCVGGQSLLTAVPSGGAGTCSLQWQSRPSASGSWSNISGATATTYLATPPSSATEYRAVYTCTAPGCCN